AIATSASVGQRTLKVDPEKAPDGAAAVIVIRPRQGGPGFQYTIPLSALPRLGKINTELDPLGRHDAVMKADALFEVAPVNLRPLRAILLRRERSGCGSNRRRQERPLIATTSDWRGAP